MKLIKMSLTIGMNEFFENKGIKTAVEFDITKDTDKTIFLHSENSDRKKILKENLLELKSDLAENSYAMVNYTIYCYETDKKKAEKMLLDKVTEEVNKRVTASEILLKRLNEIKPKFEK